MEMVSLNSSITWEIINSLHKDWDCYFICKNNMIKGKINGLIS